MANQVTCSCPLCQLPMSIPAGIRQGKRVLCPHCNHLFRWYAQEMQTRTLGQEVPIPATVPPGPVDGEDETAPDLDDARMTRTLMPEGSAPQLPTTNSDSEAIAEGHRSTARVSTADTVPGSMPRKIGRFEIRRLLGEGGFGIVYEAYDPQLDRAIALKVAKLTGDSNQRLKRFLREAKSAAILRHPHIVPLYEFGQDGDRFYLALAYIPGRSLDDHIAQLNANHDNLDFRRAVQVVRRLAEALAYAHEIGIIHRDVKPQNVMLDERGEPLLMDFGLAAREEDEKLTREGAVMGTAAYLAPEQYRGEPTPASDQYSLGATLHELLTGETPFSGPPDLQIYHHMHSEPPSPRTHRPDVPRDLETICLKCLQKDAKKRYADCQALANDLRRWLDGDPIEARPIGTVERATKWCRKNPLAAVLLAGVALSLFFGATISSVFAVMSIYSASVARTNEQKAIDKEQLAKTNARVANENALKAFENEKAALANEKRAKQAQQAALDEKKRAQRVREFLTSLFSSNDPTGLSGTGLVPASRLGKDVTAIELLESGAKQIESLQEDPLIQAALMDTIGDVFRSLGMFEKAKPLLDKSYDVRRKNLEPGHPEIAESLCHLGNWYGEKGDFDEAERYYRDALAIYQKRAGTMETLEIAEIQLRYSALLAIASEPEAEQWARQGLATRLKLLGPKHRDTAIAKFTLVAALLEEGKGEEAAPLAKEALDFVVQSGGKEKGGILEAMTQYQQAMFVGRLGMFAQAEQSLRSGLQTMQKALGKKHLYTTFFLYDLGQCYAAQRRYAETEQVWKEALDVARHTSGLENARAYILVRDYAALMAIQNRHAEGMALIDEMIQAQEKRFGLGYRWRLRSLMLVAEHASRSGQGPRATATARDVLTMIGKREKPLNPKEMRSLAEMAYELGFTSELNLVRETYQVLFTQEQKGSHRPEYRDYLNYGSFLCDRNLHKEAIPVLERSLTLARASARPADKAAILRRLGNACMREKRVAEADDYFREANKLQPKQVPPQVAQPVVPVQPEQTRLLLAIHRGDYPGALKLSREYEKQQLATVDQAWLAHQQTFLRLLTGDTRVNDMVARLEQFVEANADYDVACYSARALAVANETDLAKHEESLRKWCQPNINSTHPYLTRAMLLSRLKKDNDVLVLLQQIPFDGRAVVLNVRDLLHAQSSLRLANTVQTRANLERAVSRAENMLTATGVGNNIVLSGYATSWQLELAWYSRQLRKDRFEEVLAVERNLTEADMRDASLKNPAQVHLLKLEAGVDYVIDMTSADFDPFLRVENKMASEIARDDDSGGNLNAHLFLRVDAPGDYRLIATCFDGKTGRYKLRVLKARN